MAAAEPYDYISSGVTKDSTYTLNLTARGRVRESGRRHQIVHMADDGATEEVISLDTVPQFYLEYPWRALNESDAGTILDFWASTAKGDGMAKRFLMVHAHGTQSQQYIVRFNNGFSRDIVEGNIFAATVQIKIMGKSTT